MLRSRSFTRFTMRVGLEHFGQSVLLLVSITFLRSPVLAIFDISRSPDPDVWAVRGKHGSIPCLPVRARHRRAGRVVDAHRQVYMKEAWSAPKYPMQPSSYW